MPVNTSGIFTCSASPNGCKDFATFFRFECSTDPSSARRLEALRGLSLFFPPQDDDGSLDSTGPVSVSDVCQDKTTAHVTDHCYAYGKTSQFSFVPLVSSADEQPQGPSTDAMCTFGGCPYSYQVAAINGPKCPEDYPFCSVTSDFQRTRIVKLEIGQWPRPLKMEFKAHEIRLS